MSKIECLNVFAHPQLAAVLGNGKLPAAAAVILIVYGFVKLLRVGHRDKRMPPGPPTLPILGNLHQIPITGMYKKCVGLHRN